jgi:16S rRNA (adenine1518-N6/adenine1519-N6)-dimethyltransferase
VIAARPQGRAEIAGLLERHGLHPRKHLGQHFLADPNVVERIVRLAGVGPGDCVLEIGVGTGTLTKGLAAAGATVLGYEVDRKLEPLLAEALHGVANVEIRFEDALAADLESALGDARWTMVANLPYNVGTPLLIEVLRSVPVVERFVVMLQKEVADRLVAVPGSSAYGIPSVSIALRAEAKTAFTVSPQVFVPRPDVDSAVIVIERTEASPLADRADALAAVAFNQRRKMLRRSLSATLTEPSSQLRLAGIDPEARAEQLSADDYLRLAAAVA